MERIRFHPRSRSVVDGSASSPIIIGDCASAAKPARKVLSPERPETVRASENGSASLPGQSRRARLSRKHWRTLIRPTSQRALGCRSALCPGRDANTDPANLWLLERIRPKEAIAVQHCLDEITCREAGQTFLKTIGFSTHRS